MEEKLTKKFLEKLDSSGVGSIEFSEFYEVLKDVIPSEEQIKFYWKKLLGGIPLNQKLSNDSFFERLNHPKKISIKEEGTWWFEVFDKDESGILTKSEIQAMIKFIDWLPTFEKEEDLLKFFEIEYEEISFEKFVSVYEKQKNEIQNTKLKTLKYQNSQSKENLLNSHFKLVNLVIGDTEEMNPKKLIKEWKEKREIDTLIKIKNNIKNLPDGWVSQFFNDGGLEMITDALSSTNILSEFKEIFELEEQKLCIDLLRIIIRSNVGFNYFLKDTLLFRYLVLILLTTNDEALIDNICLLLSIACNVSDDGFFQVLNSFSFAYIVKNEKLKFEFLFKLFDKIQNQNTITNVVLLLNEILASSPDDFIAFEIFLDFEKLNVHQIHQKLENKSENEYLDTQLEILKDLLNDISQRDCVSVDSLVKKIEKSLNEKTDIKNYFFEILKDMKDLSNQNNIKKENWETLTKVFNSISKRLLNGKQVQDPIKTESILKNRILELELKMKSTEDELIKLKNKQESKVIIEEEKSKLSSEITTGGPPSLISDDSIPMVPSSIGIGCPPPPPGLPVPGMIGGPPLPPGIPNFKSQGIPFIPISPIKSEIKQIHFQKVEKRKLIKSIFIQNNLIEKSNEISKDFNIEEIEKIFSKKSKSILCLNDSKKEKKVEKMAGLLDGNVEQNISLGLESLKRKKIQSNEEIKKILLEIDSTIDIDILIQLKSIFTLINEEEDFEKVTTFKGEEKLSNSEIFIKEISIFKDLKGRMESWISMISFTEDYNKVNSKIRNLKNTIIELKTSESFQLMLSLLLALGNIVNGKSQNKLLYGFKLNSLQTISGIKISNGENLIGYLLNFSKQKYPNLIQNLFEELSSINESIKIKSIDNLEKEIKEFEKIEIEIEKSMKIAEKLKFEQIKDQFPFILNDFLKKKLKIGIRLLNSNLNELFKEIKNLEEIFSEDNLKDNLFDFLKNISSFLKIVKETKLQNDLKIERERKRKEKEIEKLKKLENKPVRKSTRRRSIDKSLDVSTKDDLEDNMRSGMNLRKKIVKKRSMRQESLLL
eukprot:gene6009-10011_t